jgi:hypothetical protein
MSGSVDIVWTVGVKINTKRKGKITCEDFYMVSFALATNTAQYFNFTSLTVRKKEISVGCSSEKTRVHEPVRIKLNFKAWRRLRQCSCRARHQIGIVAD